MSYAAGPLPRKEAAQTSEGKSSAFAFVFCVLLVTAIVLAYSNTFDVPFIYDDRDSVLANPTILKLWPPAVKLPKIMSGTTMDGRPLSNWTVSLNYAIGGVALRGYHFFNLALHCLNALLLFALVRRTFSLSSLAAFKGAADRLAAMTAALWALHPLVTEAVTYTVQRVESLAALFIMGAIYAYSRSAENRNPLPWKVCAVAGCFLGVLSKETAAVIPVLALLFDRFFHSGSFRAALKGRGRLLGAMALSWLVLAALIYSSGKRGNSVGFDLREPWLSYPLAQFHSIAHYLRLSLWPDPLILDYGTKVVKDWGRIVTGMCVVLPLLCSTLWLLRRGSPPAFLGAAFFVLLAPTSSVVPILQPIVEHRMYLPLTLVAAGGALLLNRLLGRFGEGKAALGAALALALLLGYSTYSRNDDYKSEISIWEDNIRKVPENPTGYLGLGSGLTTAGRLEEAETAFRKALALEPDTLTGIGGLGLALGRLGKTTEAEELLGRAARAAPDNPSYLMNLGNVYLLQGKNGEALEQYGKALSQYPETPGIIGAYGAALLLSGDTQGALAKLTRAVELDPGNPLYHRNAGNAHLVLGQFGAAVTELEAAVSLGMRTAEAYAMLGDAYRGLNSHPKARAAYQTSLRLDPGNRKAVAGLSVTK